MRGTPAPAIVRLGGRSDGLARRVRDLLPGGLVHANDAAGDVRFDKAVPHLRALFRDGVPIVGLCASGILVRALAPLLADKRDEPPVVAVAEDGSAVVPLLGGHRGANALARRIAAGLGVHAAVTTAGDLGLGLALDEPPDGWVLANPGAVKEVAVRLLEGGRARLLVEPGLDAGWLADAGLPLAEDGAVTLWATWREVADPAGGLTFHPRVLALGVGCERGAAPAALAALVDEVLAKAGLSRHAVACVVSHELKAAEPAVHALAGKLGVPARFFDGERLLVETSRLTARSEAVFRATGCWGVAEGAALAAAGPEASLVVPKRVGAGGVTCAVALASEPIDAAAVGRARGRLALVGLGPGGRAWRTHEAQALLDAAEELVGYGLYLDLVGPTLPGQRRHDFLIGAEEERCRRALDLAAEGRDVALVCSGDPGIYALASLVMELLEREAARPDWRRVELLVSPGVSAMQAAAARAGAPLGHDFCAVSLSDLLTPWPEIERRLEAAAAADLALALYNPVSARRREGLVRARAILLRHRAAETPVVLARNLGREGEACRTVALGELGPELVDMLTVVLVGSTRTRRVARLHGDDWVYTPRGYEVG